MRAIEQSVLDFESTVGDYADRENDVRRALADDAFHTVAEGLAQHLERENEVRRALCWLLNQDDLVLDDLLARASEALARLDVDGQRGFLESLWDRLFADWRVEGFDPADYSVIGLPE